MPGTTGFMDDIISIGDNLKDKIKGIGDAIDEIPDLAKIPSKANEVVDDIKDTAKIAKWAIVGGIAIGAIALGYFLLRKKG